MITHDAALDLAASTLDFELTDRERTALEAHLATCSSCRTELQAMQRDATRLRRLPPISPPAWVAHAIGRKRRPIAMLLLAAVLMIGGSIGAVAIAGTVLNRTTAELGPSDDPRTTATPSLGLPSPQATPAPVPLSRIADWSPGRDMGAARAFHTATRLVDGRVLIAGGGRPGGYLRTVELYDPATDAFRPAAPMYRTRSLNTATLLQDGRVLVAGGNVDTAEVYDPATDSWTFTESMRHARILHKAVLLLDGRVLVVGGAVGGPSTQTAETFDPTTNAWTAVGSMSIGRTDHTLTLLPDGRVLVAGGARTQAGIEALDTVEIFDPASGTFSTAPPMNHARARHTATLLADGLVLVVSGIQGLEVLRSAEVFDPAAATWTDVADVNERREASTLTLLPDGTVLLVGGYSQGTRTAELYDPASGTWEFTENMTELRGYHNATLLVDGRVLVTGGLDEFQSMLRSSELWLAAP